MSRAVSQSIDIRKPAVTSEKGLVASQNRIASEIGADVLRRGGNAIDAAIATSFALGVVEPWMSGIGGGGYMIVRRAADKGAQVVDFGMRAPTGLRVEDYPLDSLGGKKSNDLFPWPVVVQDANIIGAKAVAVPGHVAGMATAHAAFGSFPWADLIAPAITEAEKGLLVDWYAQLILASTAKDLAKFPASRALYLDAEGFPKASAWTAQAHTRCDQRTLATTLATIATQGAKSFYHGKMAQGMINDLTAAGGRHCLEDFSNYQAHIVPAAECQYKGHRVFGTPEMTAGPTLEATLTLLKTWSPTGSKPSAEDFATFDRAIRHANQNRIQTMGDDPVPSCTTHFNVVDAEGTMVSVTQTLLSIFGSRMTLPSSGILMNNGIMWFDPESGQPNSIGADKRCLTNMCPTLLERADGVRFGLGAAGGRKIMPAVAQLVCYLLDFGMDAETAIHEPRIDASLAEATIVDSALPAQLRALLTQKLTYVIEAPRTVYPYNFACPSIVERRGTVNAGTTEVMAHWADTVSADDRELLA